MTSKIIAVFTKEWWLLWRDKVGLIFLFLLPMCLVLFITLTSSVDANKPRKLQLVLINQDQNGDYSKGFITALNKVNSFVVNQSLPKGAALNLDNAKKEVQAGTYQALIVIPSGLSQNVNHKVQQSLPARPSNAPAPAASTNANGPTHIEVFFDPALPKNFQDQISSALEMLTQAIELRLWQQLIQQLMPQTSQTPGSAKTALVTIQTEYVQGKGAAAQPNDVQQNVPAWALFGMFFIITPLSGMIVKERKLGVMDRLRLAPVSLHTIIWGKILAFVCINLLQLVLMLAVGVFVLPWFGLPTLEVSRHLDTILAVGLSASLAATGFGMLIGSLVETPEQANVIGPFIIVILAAIGGIFVPVYLLPEGLKHMTQFSPMYWALQSFIDIFVRHAHIRQLLPNIGKLLVFALVTITLASFVLNRHRN